jgi:hypothetical protein
MATNFGSKSIGYNSSVIATLAEHGCDPIAILAELAVHSEDPEMKFKAAKELAGYVTPKLKSVDIKVSEKRTAEVAVVKFSEVSPEQFSIIKEKIESKMTRSLQGADQPVSVEEAAARTMRGEARSPLEHKVVAAFKKFAVPSGMMVEHLRYEGEKEMPEVAPGEVVTDPSIREDDWTASISKPFTTVEEVIEGEARRLAESEDD